MQVQYAWWILALVLGVLEIVSGSFHLLVFALGSAAAGVAAWAGATLTVQVLVASAITVAGWLWLYRHGPSRKAPAGRGDPDMLLDIGESLDVDEWTDDRRARVRYRGADWAVELAAGAPASHATPGRFVIDRIVGNRLVVRRAESGA